MSKVKHIALIKFKEGTSEEQITKIFDDFLDLSENVPGIEDYVAGPNCSPEGQSEGLTHGFIMTFTDASARDAYLINLDHEKLKTAELALVEKLIIFDIEL